LHKSLNIVKLYVLFLNGWVVSPVFSRLKLDVLAMKRKHIVACRPDARQRPQKKQLYNRPQTATKEWCFLCDPCRDVISRTISEELVSQWSGVSRLVSE
jgi:hypothetical protein